MRKIPITHPENIHYDTLMSVKINRQPCKNPHAFDVSRVRSPDSLSHGRPLTSAASCQSRDPRASRRNPGRTFLQGSVRCYLCGHFGGPAGPARSSSSRSWHVATDPCVPPLPPNEWNGGTRRPKATLSSLISMTKWSCARRNFIRFFS